MYSKNLIPIGHEERTSDSFFIAPDSAPVIVRLITSDDSCRLPACAQARIVMRNSAGKFNDLAFIGAGRDLAARLDHVGEFRVIVPAASSARLAFGVDLVSSKFAPPSAPIPMRD